MSIERVQAEVDVGGTRIRYDVSGPAEAPTVLLLHGGGAHRGWWDHVRPDLEQQLRVAAMDLSGHGDSDRRPAYELALWADEIVAVADELIAANGRLPVLAAHSMGGRVGVIAAARAPRSISTLLMVETGIRRPGTPRPPNLKKNPGRPLRVYGSEEEILAAFRLKPDQPDPAAAVMDSLARKSVRPVEGGWTWRYDPSTMIEIDDQLIADHLRRVRAPVSAVFGSHSPFAVAPTWEFIEECVGYPVPRRMIIDGYHHVLLDHPAETAAAMLELLLRCCDGDRFRSSERGHGGGRPKIASVDS